MEVLLALGKNLLDRGDGDGALPILQGLQLRQHALSSPQKVFVFSSLGQLWLSQGDERKAKQYLERGLRFDPTHEISRHLMAQIEA